MPINLPDLSSTGEIILPDGSQTAEVLAPDGTVVWSASALTISATLYSGTASMTLYEDTNGDGVAENSQTYSLIDGVNEYDLSPFDLSTGNMFWYELDMDNANETTTVEIEYMELEY